MSEALCTPSETNALRLCAARALLQLGFAYARVACHLLPRNHPTRTFLLARTHQSRETALNSLRGPRDYCVVAGAVGLLGIASAVVYDGLTTGGLFYALGWL